MFALEEENNQRLFDKLAGELEEAGGRLDGLKSDFETKKGAKETYDREL